MAPNVDPFLQPSVICHGEVQTSSTIFRKKREYVVLTDSHLYRFRSQQKAADNFSSVPYSPPQRVLSKRYSMTPSMTSVSEQSTFTLDSPIEPETGTSLRHVIAVYQLDDGRPYFAIEIAFLDPDTNDSFTLTLQFNEVKEMLHWLQSIRQTANAIRPPSSATVHKADMTQNSKSLGHGGDNRSQEVTVYKVVQRNLGRPGARSSTEDLTKIASTVCFLSVGAFKIHLFPLHKLSARSSSPALSTYRSQTSYGIMTLVGLRVNETDDTFELHFRSPFQKKSVIYLASMESHEIALRLRYLEVHLRPGWETRPYTFLVPQEVKEQIHRTSSPHPPDEKTFHSTLVAYCTAYDVVSENICYNITEREPGYFRFELLDHRENRPYTAFELLSILRALRYNECFREVSFSGISLDILNGLHDRLGNDHVCCKTKRGTVVGILEEFQTACLLVQEIRSIAMTNRKLNLLDFTSSISGKPPSTISKTKDIGCGIIEALFPLCKMQRTNVEWVYLNNIHLGETDLDWIVMAIVDKMCHFRGLEFRNCGLTDRGISLILDSLEGQEDTLESLDLSGNPCRISPAVLDFHLSRFAYLRILKLENLTRVSSSDPLLKSPTLQQWRLQQLSLTGTFINSATLAALASYLSNNNKSCGLQQLNLARTSLNGRDLAKIVRAIPLNTSESRFLFLDISHNYIEEGITDLAVAIGKNHGPSYLKMKSIEFEHDASFQMIIRAFTQNRTMRALDISCASLPCDATEETCQVLEDLFANNHSLEWLDMSGEDSRLETSKLGVGINRALRGLKFNTTLRYLDIQYQQLGLQGASTLADVLKVNTGLIEVHYEHNEIPLSGYTDLIDSLGYNTTVRWLPSLEDARKAHLSRTEREIQELQDSAPVQKAPKPSVRSKIGSIVGRGSKERKSSLSGYLTPNDITATRRIVSDSWATQETRMKRYLQRNNDLAEGVPIEQDSIPEGIELPSSADDNLHSIFKMVKLETTPTMETDFNFDFKI